MEPTDVLPVRSCRYCCGGFWFYSRSTTISSDRFSNCSSYLYSSILSIYISCLERRVKTLYTDCPVYSVMVLRQCLPTSAPDGRKVYGVDQQGSMKVVQFHFGCYFRTHCCFFSYLYSVCLSRFFSPHHCDRSDCIFCLCQKAVDAASEERLNSATRSVAPLRPITG